MDAANPNLRATAGKLADALARKAEGAPPTDHDQVLRWLGDWAPVLRFAERLCNGNRRGWEKRRRDKSAGWMPLSFSDRALIGRAWVTPIGVASVSPSSAVARVVDESVGAAVSWALGQAWMRGRNVVLVEGACRDCEMWSLCKPYLSESDGITIVDRLTPDQIAQRGIETVIATPASCSAQFASGLPAGVEVVDPSPRPGPIAVAPHLYARDELRYLAWRTALDLRAAELGVPGGASRVIVCSDWLQLDLYLSMLSSLVAPDAPPFQPVIVQRGRCSPNGAAAAEISDGGVDGFLAALPGVIQEHAPSCATACIFIPTSTLSRADTTLRLKQVIDEMPCAGIGINQSPILIRLLAELSWDTGALAEGGAANLGDQRVVLYGETSRFLLSPLLAERTLYRGLATYLARPGLFAGLGVAGAALLTRIRRSAA